MTGLHVNVCPIDVNLLSDAVNCWPSVSGNETYVSLEYEASSMFDLTNVIISVPLPALREAPSVRQCDGEWRFEMEFGFFHSGYLFICSEMKVMIVISKSYGSYLCE